MYEAGAVKEMAATAASFASVLPKGEKLASDCKTCNLSRNYLILYLAAFTGFCLIWQVFHDIGLSTLLTFSVLIQVLGLAALLMGIVARESVHGLSLRSMTLQAVSFFLRLCSTCWLKGYIPVDSTGDWLYQLGDFSAWILCLQICYLMKTKYQSTYQETEDSFPSLYAGLFCAVLASVVHPDLNNRPLFDSIWSCSLYIDVVSTLPQLWMMGKLGGKIDALSAHYVALIALSRTVDMIFWYYGFEELAPEDGGFNLAGWSVFSAHLIHIILMWDFIYCYCRAMYMGKLLDRQIDFGEIMIDV